MSTDSIFPDHWGVAESVTPNFEQVDIETELNFNSPLGNESIFHQEFEETQQSERYLKDIQALMQRNGISEFYYTHLPLHDSNTGILFYGKINHGQLSVKLKPTALLLKDERWLFEELLIETEFIISAHTKGNLILKGKSPEWKLIETNDYFSSLPYETNDYHSRIKAKNYNVKYQELRQIYEEMLAKKSQLFIQDKENKIFQLSKIIQKQLEHPFYQTVRLCVYVKQVDAQRKVIAENLLKTDYKTKGCDVTLNITIMPDGKVQIRHKVNPDFLKEYEGKWEKEAKARGLEIDIAKLRKESNAEFEKKETEYSFFQKFIQDSKALFNDQIGGYVQAVQATQKVAKNVWAEGAVYKSNWYSQESDHKNWPEYMQFNPVVGGVTDGTIDEIIGIKMAITTVYDIATDEEKRKSLAKVFTAEGMEQLYEGLKKEANETLQDTEKSEHFVGKSTVAVATLFLGGAGIFAKAGKMGEVLDSATGFVKRITNPKVIKIYEDIRNFFLRKPKGGGVEANEYLQKLDDDALNSLGEELVEESDELSRFKLEPQKFIYGKHYENAIRRLIDEGDPKFMDEVSKASGIALEQLKSYIPLHQVQIRIPNSNGGFTTMDNMWIKKVTDPLTGKEYLEAIVNECKLSNNSPFSTRQIEFENALDKSNSYFDLRNIKFQERFEIKQNTEIRIKSYIKTYGEGGIPPDLNNFKITKIW